MARRSSKDSDGGDSGGRSARRGSRLASVRAERRRREAEDPLEVRVTLAFRFGPQPEDRIVMLDEVPIPMVGSIFRYRDRMVRSFSMLMLRAGLAQPKVVAELLPAARWLGAGKAAPEAGGKSKAAGRSRRTRGRGDT